MSDIPYTASEQRDKKYRVSDAVSAAKLLTKGPLCVSSLKVGYDTPITLVQLNGIVDRLVDDTNFWR